MELIHGFAVSFDTGDFPRVWAWCFISVGVLQAKRTFDGYHPGAAAVSPALNLYFVSCDGAAPIYKIVVALSLDRVTLGVLWWIVLYLAKVAVACLPPSVAPLLPLLLDLILPYIST